MPKKTGGYIVTGLVVIAVLILVHLFITKGYPGKGTGVVTPQTPTPIASSQAATQETGSVASNKISLTVTSPKNGDTLDSTNVTVKGKTTPGADVFVNDVVGKADASGNFSISIGLDEGSNVIVVSVNDSVGNATEQDLNVAVASFQ
jgi:hypothetical protein